MTHFLKMDTDKRRVYGVVLEGNKVDLQGDVVTDPELEEAAIRAFGVQAGMNHTRMGIGKMIASFPLTKEIQESLGIDIGRSVWIVGLEITDNEAWQAVKNGELTGFSVGGFSRKEVMT